MKIVGLITEYNPLHNGHLYHIRKAKEITGADAAVVIMSGNYVQRGAPAIMSKYLRTRAALAAGAAAVFELPVWCACGSAEFFASGAISILHRLGCIDSYCFGSECGNLALLKKIAEILAEEPPEYQILLKNELKKGLPFPKARQHALASYTGDNTIEEILSEPNNILGIEYIKASLRQRSSMTPYTIRRIGSSYHEEELDGRYSSASAIRKLILESPPVPKTEDYLSAHTAVLPFLEGQIPPSSLELLREAYHVGFPVCASDFSLLFRYRLLSETKESLLQYADLSSSLAGRILNRRNEYTSFEGFCDLLKTKEITYSRISRALFHMLLHITKEDMLLFQEENGCAYGRMLGFSRAETQLLKLLKKHTSIPLISRPARPGLLNKTAAKMLESDIYASNIYESVVSEKFRTPFVHECRQQVVIL